MYNFQMTTEDYMSLKKRKEEDLVKATIIASTLWSSKYILQLTEKQILTAMLFNTRLIF